MARTVPLLTALAAGVLIAACAATPYEAPQVAHAPTTQALKKLSRMNGEPVAVSIYEFRSSISEVSARAATDMFKTALVQSGRFRVVERARVNEGVLREKQLNAQGLSSGASAQQALREARYLFEGAVTEANAGENQRSSAITIAGLELGGGSNRDTISVDVRIVEVATGDVVDSITVRKAVNAGSASVSGIGNLIATVMSQRGRTPSAYTPDVRASDSRREGLDAALRAAIEHAVAELAKRFEP